MALLLPRARRSLLFDAIYINAAPESYEKFAHDFDPCVSFPTT
jgi:hypothetical protein